MTQISSEQRAELAKAMKELQEVDRELYVLKVSRIACRDYINEIRSTFHWRPITDWDTMSP